MSKTHILERKNEIFNKVHALDLCRQEDAF